jgi:hypothetical protein
MTAEENAGQTRTVRSSEQVTKNLPAGSHATP